jgi:hypothetical protein
MDGDQENGVDLVKADAPFDAAKRVDNIVARVRRTGFDNNVGARYAVMSRGPGHFYGFVRAQPGIKSAGK